MTTCPMAKALLLPGIEVETRMLALRTGELVLFLVDNIFNRKVVAEPIGKFTHASIIGNPLAKC